MAIELIIFQKPGGPGTYSLVGFTGFYSVTVQDLAEGSWLFAVWERRAIQFYFAWVI